MLGDIFFFKLSTSVGVLLSDKDPQIAVPLRTMRCIQKYTASIWIPAGTESSSVVYAGSAIYAAAAMKNISAREYVMDAHTKNISEPFDGIKPGEIKVEEIEGNELIKEFMRVQTSMYIQDGVISDVEKILHAETLNRLEKLEFISRILSDYNQTK